MKRATTREQREAARNALDELCSYRSPTGEEDETFDQLNEAAARTQDPLSWWQQWRLYQTAPAPELTRSQRLTVVAMITWTVAALVYAVVKLVTGS